MSFHASFSIYDNDADHPNKYVVKESRADHTFTQVSSTVLGVKDTLAEARTLVPAGSACMYQLSVSSPGGAIEVWHKCAQDRDKAAHVSTRYDDYQLRKNHTVLW